jgi:hypothetical protein
VLLALLLQADQPDQSVLLLLEQVPTADTQLCEAVCLAGSSL